MKTLSKLVLYTTVIALLAGSLMAVTPALAENTLFADRKNPAPEVNPEQDTVPNRLPSESFSSPPENPNQAKEARLATSLIAFEKEREVRVSSASTNDSETSANAAVAVVPLGNEPVLRAVESAAVEKAVEEAAIAKAAAEKAAAFQAKIDSMTNGSAGQLTGMYVKNSFAMNAGEFWQFGLAAQHGSLGLLAHNYAGGGNFFSLGVGSVVNLVYGDGSIRKFQVKKIRRFEALQPNSPTSQFIDLDNGGGKQSVTKVFNAIYNSGNPLVLQTCIANNGVGTWGRLFVIAVPI